MNDYRIEPATARHVPHLPAIERAAATLLAGYAPAAALENGLTAGEFARAREEQRLWIALNGDTPVGFALVEHFAPKHVHLAEMDVHPDHGRRGVGRQLLTHVLAALGDSGVITLTTFRDPPWNRPFYASLGFEEWPETRWNAPLRACVEREEAHGLARRTRIIMGRALPF
ncbi:GNAT family N-acetyltransferase [Paludibacterium paludis]|uniref:N-acetyltransferase GCN5 n=1 Tax=Paludibacterium paludis TaxID=1225769 RepID=A0A918UBY0_9NEIS|nr:GNAT family N-acetyltransferase [Paludibacterium paludis]GGY28333.1 N-acetyltransferase GCN5 [Paludibacterium paludis]